MDADTPIPSGRAFFTLGQDFIPGQAPSPATFTFPAPVQMVGAYVEAAKYLAAGIDGVVTVTAFDSLGVSLGQLSVVTNGAGWNRFVNPPVNLGPLDTWIGLRTLDGSYSISSISIQGWYLVADNLMFTPVPEPASVAVGLLGVVFILRRR